MSDKLTPKQERFVQALVSGASQREAYRSAYNCERLKPESIDSLASRLFAKVKLRSRYDELVAEAAAGAVYDRQRAIADLTEIVDIGLAHIRRTKQHKENIDDHGKRELADLPRGASTVISAIEKLDKLLGLSLAGEGDSQIVIVDDV
jgi:transposase